LVDRSVEVARPRFAGAVASGRSDEGSPIQAVRAMRTVLGYGILRTAGLVSDLGRPSAAGFDPQRSFSAEALIGTFVRSPGGLVSIPTVAITERVDLLPHGCGV
jgi:hypothetical protein